MIPRLTPALAALIGLAAYAATPDALQPTDFAADAGGAFSAYVGDTVILSADGSRGPGRQALDTRWEQVRGPTAVLDDATVGEPSFVPEHPGLYIFELQVGRDGVWSPPAQSLLLVHALDTRTHLAN